LLFFGFFAIQSPSLLK